MGLGALWLAGGLYSVVMEGRADGWWFIIGGLIVLVSAVLLSELEGQR